MRNRNKIFCFIFRIIAFVVGLLLIETRYGISGAVETLILCLIVGAIALVWSITTLIETE